MRIQNNIPAYNTHRNYNIANNQVASSAEKLSSGYRINRAGDDAAGLAISEKMRAQIRGLEMASKNSLDAVSLVQTAEGGLQKTHDILQRMRELAVQSASDTNEQVIDRGALDAEFQQLKDEINDIARTTRFNDQNLIDGTFQKTFYSVGITDSKLKTGVTASVARVGTKNIQVGDDIRVKAQYVAGREAVNASRSKVTVEGATTFANGITVGGANTIKQAQFLANVGAQHNGKTFTFLASGTGSDPNDLKVRITDGDTVYEGVVSMNGNMADGGTMDIHFDGVGTLTLLVGMGTTAAAQDISKIAEAMNTKEMKFLNDKVQVYTGMTALDMSLDTAGAYKNGTIKTLAQATVSAISINDADGVATFTPVADAVSLAKDDGTTTKEELALSFTGVGATADIMRAGQLKLTIAGIGNIYVNLSDSGAIGDPAGTYLALDITARQTEIVAAINAAIGANGTVTSLGAVGGGSNAVDKVDDTVVLSLNGESVTLNQNSTSASFNSSGVSLYFNPLDIRGMTAANKNDVGAAGLFTSAPVSTNHIGIKVVQTAGKELTIQTGANQGDELQINIDAMDLEMLGLTNSSIDTQKNASSAITLVNNAINQVSTQRSKLGALQNRLNFKIENLDISAENLTAAESRIRDVDMAKEMTAFSKKNILSQAATAMLAQANSLPQNVLQLLR